MSSSSTSENQNQQQQLPKKVVLAIDIGSSSIRCSAYSFSTTSAASGKGNHMNENDASSLATVIIKRVEDMEDLNCTSSRPIRSVEPNTGKIISLFPSTTASGGKDDDDDDSSNNNKSLLDHIDDCIDETLLKLRKKFTATTSNNNNKDRNNLHIVGIGFSTFVMNLIGVNKDGMPINKESTLSYACNSPKVKQKCNIIRNALSSSPGMVSRSASTTKDSTSSTTASLLHHYYQISGTPIHSCYALPQLLEYYDNKNNNTEIQDNDNRVQKWTTITSLCLSRWTGINSCDIPISYSEASWTGLLNFHTCKYIFEDTPSNRESTNTSRDMKSIFQDQLSVLIPDSIRTTLPPLSDYYFKDNTETNENDDADNNNGKIIQILQRGIQQNLSTPTGLSTTAMKNTYWDRWPELRGYTPATTNSHGENKEYCHLFLGIGDGACANIGSKCSNLNRIAVTIGTSAAARIVVPLPIRNQNDETTLAPKSSSLNDTTTVLPPPGLFCYRIDKSNVLIGGALTDGGSIIEWLQSLLSISNTTTTNDNNEASSLLSFEQYMGQVDKLIIEDYNHYADDDNSSAASGNTLLTVIPFFSGERSTGYRDGATGTIFGITRETQTRHILKACLESIVIRLNVIIQLIINNCCSQQQMDTTTTNATPLIIASGAALEKNDTWRQLLSDCTNLNVLMDHTTKEGTSRGVARLIAIAAVSTSNANSDNTDNILASQEEPILLSLSSSSAAAGSELESLIDRHYPEEKSKNFWKYAIESQELLLDRLSPLFSK